MVQTERTQSQEQQQHDEKDPRLADVEKYSAVLRKCDGSPATADVLRHLKLIIEKDQHHPSCQKHLDGKLRCSCAVGAAYDAIRGARMSGFKQGAENDVIDKVESPFRSGGHFSDVTTKGPGICG